MMNYQLAGCDINGQIPGAPDNEPWWDQMDFWIYEAPGALVNPDPMLVIYLHGSAHTPIDAALGIGWNELAERERIDQPLEIDAGRRRVGRPEGAGRLLCALVSRSPDLLGPAVRVPERLGIERLRRLREPQLVPVLGADHDPFAHPLHRVAHRDHGNDRASDPEAGKHPPEQPRRCERAGGVVDGDVRGGVAESGQGVGDRSGAESEGLAQARGADLVVGMGLEVLVDLLPQAARHRRDPGERGLPGEPRGRPRRRDGGRGGRAARAAR